MWVASLESKGYLWHLSNALVEGLCTLTPALLGDERDGDYAELLEEMIILHNSLDCVSVQPFRRRTATEGGTETTTRGFVHCFCGLSKGTLLLREGLGLDDYPYGQGVGAQSLPPASSWMVSWKRPAPPKNTERRVTYPAPPMRNFRGYGPSSQAGPFRAGPSQVQAAAYVALDAPAAATLPLPQVVHRVSPTTAAPVMVTSLEPPAFAEPFPAANVRPDFCRGRSLPEQCTRRLLTMFPPVGADIWDASPVVAEITLAKVFARVRRQVSSLAVDVHRAGQPALAQRLINDLSGRALGSTAGLAVDYSVAAADVWVGAWVNTSLGVDPLLFGSPGPKWWGRPCVRAAVAQRSQLWAGACASAAELWAGRGVRLLCRPPCGWELRPAGAILP